MINIKDLNKTFRSAGKEFQALININLNIKKGDIYGIIGLSGAGKSTLVRCINRLEEADSGKIIVDELDVLRLKKEELNKFRKKVGMIFQDFNLLKQKTVYENIALPLFLEKLPEKDISIKVNQLLEYVGLKTKKYNYPSELSGGEKQRVAIARAISNNPKILLSDEATSSLDPKTTSSILDLLKNIQAEFGITVVMITHQMEVVKQVCNQVAIMEQGEIIEKNKVENLFNSPKTDLAKTFINSVNNLAVDEIINPNDFTGKLIRLGYLGDSSKYPIVSSMVKTFDIDVNIISGNINKLQSTNVGHLTLELIGSQKEIDKSIDFLKNKNVNVEVV